MKMNSMGFEPLKVFLKPRECPLIIPPILDLVQNDPEWQKSDFTLQSLLNAAISITPKSNFGDIKFHPSFYQNGNILQNLQNYFTWVNSTHTEFVENEDLILELLASYLKRKICFTPILIPIFKFQDGKTFGKEFEETFDILGYRNHNQSFYISAVKRDQ